MSLVAELVTLLSLFFTIVVSNFLARMVLKRTGWKPFGLDDYRKNAFCVTVVAVACEAAWLSWDAPTITSIIVGFIFAFLVMHLPERNSS